MELYREVHPTFNKHFWQLVGNAKRIAITAHISPDDDAIASVLALYQIILQKQPDKTVEIIITGRVVERFASFQYFDQIKFVDDLANNLEDTDLLITLDGSQHYRFTGQVEKLKAKLPAQTICIDHHSSSVDEFTLATVVPDAPATTSIIYQLFQAEIEINKPLAETLLLGILGDTGNFSFLKLKDGYIFDIVRNLLKIAGINSIGEFQSRYRLIPDRVFKLIQMLIANTAHNQTAGWGNWQSSFLPRSVITKQGYSDNEISSASHIYMSHYLRVIEGYPWGIVITPDENSECSISARSQPGSANSRELMEKTDLGGGHDRAAGGTFELGDDKPRDPEKCLEWFKNWLTENKPSN
ncbi:MAG: DHH family phosphoesterase [Patescibacteria group bacterium]|nr:DHH family phosphoesterase [Patescibacteria group bacterium]